MPPAALLAGILLVLGGCGQSGPLQLPTQPPWPAPVLQEEDTTAVEAAAAEAAAPDAMAPNASAPVTHTPD